MGYGGIGKDGPPRRVAAVDVGSNTVRLMVAERRPDLSGEDTSSSFDVIGRSFQITRLGEGMGDEGKDGRALRDGAVDRTVKALSRFAETWREMGVSDYRVVATSAAREAKNGEELIEAAGRLGIEVEIISEVEEAELSLKGVAGTVDIARGIALTFDVGGGSTEFTLTVDGELIDTLSTDLGVVRLKERFISSDPPVDDEIAELEKFVEKRVVVVYNRYIEKASEKIGGAGGIGGEGGGEKSSLTSRNDPHLAFPNIDILVGTAGTATTLAAIDMGIESVDEYDPARVDGYRLSYSRISEYLDSFRSITNEERLSRYPVLERGREDVITVGVVIILAVMKTFGCKMLTVSDGGLLEGIVIGLMGR